MKILEMITIFLVIGTFLKCTPTKVVSDPDTILVGQWNLVTENTQQGDVDIVMTLDKEEEKFVGNFNSVMGQFEMLDLSINTGLLSCKFSVHGMIFEVDGKFVNQDFIGQTVGMGGTFVTKGSKVLE